MIAFKNKTEKKNYASQGKLKIMNNGKSLVKKSKKKKEKNQSNAENFRVYK